MVSTVADLITARTADALVTEQLAVLTTEEFPADSWQPGSVPRTLVLADATALAALSETPPDIAVLDIKMPRMDGVDRLALGQPRSLCQAARAAVTAVVVVIVIVVVIRH